MRASRETDVPEELVAALTDDPVTRGAFEGLPPSHRNEYVEWTAEAKRPETRRRRAAKAVERLRGAAPQR